METLKKGNFGQKNQNLRNMLDMLRITKGRKLSSSSLLIFPIFNADSIFPTQLVTT